MPIDRTALAHFTGTERYHRISQLFPRLVMTDGAKYVAENGGISGAYWLMDAIGSYQPDLIKRPRLRDAQFWKLEVWPDNSARLTCVPDSDEEPVVEQHIDFTDFDMPECKLYCMPAGDGMNYVIMLPSEY
jgi:hypothetical protein